MQNLYYNQPMCYWRDIWIYIPDLFYIGFSVTSEFPLQTQVKLFTVYIRFTKLYKKGKQSQQFQLNTVQSASRNMVAEFHLIPTETSSNGTLPVLAVHLNGSKSPLLSCFVLFLFRSHQLYIKKLNAFDKEECKLATVYDKIKCQYNLQAIFKPSWRCGTEAQTKQLTTSWRKSQSKTYYQSFLKLNQYLKLKKSN